MQVTSRYALLFFGQMLNFVIAVINIRAASKGKIAITMGSDFLFCAVNFILIQKVAQANNYQELLAYAIGGSIGSGLAILVTKRWDHT